MTTKQKAAKPSTTAAPQAKSAPAPKQSLYARAVLSERTKKADWNATRDECIEDLRAVQKEHPDSFIGRNFYRVHGKYSDSTWNQHFGTFAQFRRSADLELSRSQQHLEKKIARHAHLDVYRAFHTVEVAPWIGKYEKPQDSSRFKTMLVAADFHDVEVDRFCLSVFLATAKRVQPDIIVLNGDVFDAYEFSYFSQDPRLYDIKGRFEFVHDEIFKPLREACPNAQIDLIMGNHEHRILRLLADRTPAFKILADLIGISFSTLLGLDKWQINLVSKSDLAAYNAKETAEEIKRNYQKYYGTVVCNHIADDGFGMSTVTGHTHKPKLTTKVTEVMGPIFHLTLGGMVKVDQEYHQQAVNTQNSFALLHVDTFAKSVCPEHIVFGAKHVVVGGIFYSRVEEGEDR
jgi:predicted phosphodiesterase